MYAQKQQQKIPLYIVYFKKIFFQFCREGGHTRSSPLLDIDDYDDANDDTRRL